MLFYILKTQSTFTKVPYFLKIYCHESFEDLKIHGALVAFEEGGHRQHGDLRSLLFFPLRKESRLRG
jgi:hypothetical protein